MLERFKKNIQEKSLFAKEDRILLAVSGGVDSVAMCDLFFKAGFSFAIAHCNFQLRDQESDGDEVFVKEIALKYKVPIYVNRFNVHQYVKENQVSIQVAARELRYKWFKELIIEYHYDYLATAHHSDDVLETFFINLLRGTGIAGLHGILEKNDTTIRPLLFTNKSDILEYAKEMNLIFREDSSNLCDKYTRNKIRHHLVPLLEETNIHAKINILSSIEKIKDAEEIFLKTIDEVRQRLLVKEKDQIQISIPELQKLQPLNIYLFELLKEFGFNTSTINDIEESLEAESGKAFFSSSHKLVKDRNLFLITNYELQITNKEYLIKNTTKEITEPIFLKFEIIIKNDFVIPLSNKIACLDFDQLKFPLTLRKWKHGDSFYPLGMKGKKKLSDFFIDKKLSLVDKENTWVVCSGNNIAWVVGNRIDERYKIKENTRQLFLVHYI